MAIETKTSKVLNVTKTIEVDGVAAMSITASINTDNPTNANLNPYISNQELYKTNCTEILKAIATAQNEIYAEQDKLIAETNKGVSGALSGGTDNGTEK